MCYSIRLSFSLLSPIPAPLYTFVLVQVGRWKSEKKTKHRIEEREYWRLKSKELRSKIYLYVFSSVHEKSHEQVEIILEDKRVIFDFNLHIFIYYDRRENRVLFVVLLYFSPGFSVHEKVHKQVYSNVEDERVVFDFNLHILICSEQRDSCLLLFLCLFGSSF